ncbi:high affinity immunoglobulin gamma Fc receptor I-like [Melospiza melodia melodia]|uniref:high affinity immunoglobulin gamma Fc receptor I-like n=1 Tax=Melospiza melodia melodia TaxID=1914991 RepID=UPI002FD3C552
MAGKVALLLWAQTLGLAGAETTQLLVEPPWRSAVLWDRVTLTCQGLGNTGVTTCYKDMQCWRQEGHNSLTVTKNGTYTCERPSRGLSPPVRVLDAPLVLQVPVRALLEDDTVTLHCRRWRDNPVSSVSFYRAEKKLQELCNGTELSLSPLQLQHSGCYSCGSMVKSRVSWGWEESESVTLTVHELFSVPVLEGPSEPTMGSPLTLSCLSTPSPWGPDVWLDQDGHQALCPELALEVTTQEQGTAVAAGVCGSLLFLLLLLAVIRGWH